MTDSAWDSLISANKKAELKYRNVNPTLKYCLGCPAPEKSRDLFPKKKKPGTLFNIIEEKFDGFKFLSIPDLTFLHRSDHVVSSEFASVNYPCGRVTLFDVEGKVLNTFPKEGGEKDVHFFGITSLRNDDVALCTGDGIAIWNLEGKLISKFTSNAVENCCHVTLLRNGQLATTCITDVEKKCVTLWDPRSGRVTSQFGSRPEVIEINPLKQKQKILIRNSDIRLPWFLASDSKMNIHISDRNAQCIKLGIYHEV